MNLIQQLINKKVNNITVPELLKYCHQYDISITNQQAAQVVSVIRQKAVNIYHLPERMELLHKISLISNPETAKKVDGLLQKLL